MTEARLLKELHWSIDQLDAAPPHRLRRYIAVWNAEAELDQERAERAGSGSSS